jgi:hypothetical protein
VEQLDISAPFAEYLRSGFGGNHYGCTYSVDNFVLSGDGGVKAEDAAALLP